MLALHKFEAGRCGGILVSSAKYQMDALMLLFAASFATSFATFAASSAALFAQHSSIH